MTTAFVAIAHLDWVRDGLHIKAHWIDKPDMLSTVYCDMFDMFDDVICPRVER